MFLSKLLRKVFQIAKSKPLLVHRIICRFPVRDSDHSCHYDLYIGFCEISDIRYMSIFDSVSDVLYNCLTYYCVIKCWTIFVNNSDLNIPGSLNNSDVNIPESLNNSDVNIPASLNNSDVNYSRKTANIYVHSNKYLSQIPEILKICSSILVCKLVKASSPRSPILSRIEATKIVDRLYKWKTWYPRPLLQGTHSHNLVSLRMSQAHHGSGHATT